MKNKKVIFAIILFLLIGLTIFTFANPSSNEKTFDEEQKEIQDGDGNTKDDTNTTIEENNGESDITTNDDNTNEVPNNIMVGNQDRNVTIVRDQITANIQNNDNYNNALAAVEKAESTITQNDVDTARDLVEKLDDGNEKSNLENRLEQVQDIIDVSGLVATLEGKTNSAKSRTDILAAKKYRDVEQKIKEKVESLKESKEKDGLESRLNDLSSILDDNTAPKIEGTPDDEYTNTVPVSLTLDGEDYTVTLNGENYTDELSFSEDGTYTVTVTDKAFNEATVKFTIDTTNPTFNGILDGHQYNHDITIDVDDDNLESIVVDNRTAKTINTVNNGTILTDEGLYVIIATDKAGNSTKVYVLIDKTYPVIDDVIDGEYYKTDVTPKITEENVKSITLKKDDKEVSYTKDSTITEDGSYVLTVEDRAGNVTTKKFTIDKTLPTFNDINGKTYNGSYLDVKSLTVDVKDVNLDTITVYNYKTGETKTVENGFELTEEAIYKITATDKAKNEMIVYVAIDRTAPIFKNVKNGHTYNEKKTLEIEDLRLKEVSVYNYKTKKTRVYTFQELFDGTKVELNDDATYTIIATDFAGHSIKVYVAIDTQTPKVTDEFTGEEIVNGKSYKQVKPVIDGTGSKIKKSTLNNENFTSGTIINTDGDYTLKVIDTANNSYEVSFKIDNDPIQVTYLHGFVSDWPNYYNTSIDTFAKIGDNVQFVIHSKETFAGKPKLYVNDEYITDFEQNDDHYGEKVYSCLYKIPESVIDGETLTYEIRNISDEAGNGIVFNDYKGDKLTNENANKIVFDTKGPEIELSGKNLIVKDKNDFKARIDQGITVINDWKITPDVVVDGMKYTEPNISWLTSGKYTVTARDLAGNTTTLDIDLDNTAPTLTQLEILNITNDGATPKKNAHFANDDARIRLIAVFDEDIVQDKVVVKINGNPVEISRFKRENLGYYTIGIDISNILKVTSLAENEPIKFEISGLQDEAGNLVNNKTGILTNENIITTRGFNEVKYDKSPIIGGLESGKTYTDSVTFTITDNSDSYTIYEGGNTSSCDELINAGVSQRYVPKEQFGTYSSGYTYDITENTVKSMCVVDSADNQTFINNITLKKSTE